MKEGDFNDLLENHDNDLDHERVLVTFFIVNEWGFKVFIEICKYCESFLYLPSPFRISFFVIFLYSCISRFPLL